MSETFQLQSQSVPSGFSSAEWETPNRIFEPLDVEFGFTLDVCATEANRKCERYFNVEMDGLKCRWAPEVCWMNPPYSELNAWMCKAHAESLSGATVVCLVPSATDTRWWHNYAMKGEVRFVRGRIKFGGAKGTPTFSSSIVVFRGEVTA